MIKLRGLVPKIEIELWHRTTPGRINNPVTVKVTGYGYIEIFYMAISLCGDSCFVTTNCSKYACAFILSKKQAIFLGNRSFFGNGW